jgi:hypothetical protein
MSSTHQIESVRTTERRYPADAVHNGHSYRKGYKVQSATVRQVRDIRREEKRNRAGVMA